MGMIPPHPVVVSPPQQVLAVILDMLLYTFLLYYPPQRTYPGVGGGVILNEISVALRPSGPVDHAHIVHVGLPENPVDLPKGPVEPLDNIAGILTARYLQQNHEPHSEQYAVPVPQNYSRLNCKLTASPFKSVQTANGTDNQMLGDANLQVKTVS